MANNKEIAHQILTAVGGASNLKDATHCMTRLRLYLKDDSIPKDEEVKAIGGVLGVVRGGQQYQVIIGTNVPKVYEELCKLANLTANAPVEDAKAAAEDAAVAKPKLTPKQVGKNIMGYMAGCMTPLIPVLLAGALFRCINSLCGPELLELYPAESDLYILFDFLYDAAFYFMPILAGFNAAKQLGIAHAGRFHRLYSHGTGFCGLCYVRGTIHSVWYPLHRYQLCPDSAAHHAVGFLLQRGV